jgi:hypothetical protein
MSPDYSHTAEISGIWRMCRSNQSRERHRHGLVKSDPPGTRIEGRHGCSIEERQAMKVIQDICDFLILRVDFANAIHRLVLESIMFVDGIGAINGSSDHLTFRAPL